MLDSEILQAETKALEDILKDDPAAMEKWIAKLGMYKSLVFRHIRGVHYLVLRDHASYDGPAYHPIKRISVSEAKSLNKQHPTVRFLFESPA